MRRKTSNGRTDVPSEMPLRGREEDESALFAQQYPFRATFEGSSQYSRDTPTNVITNSKMRYN